MSRDKSTNFYSLFKLVPQRALNFCQLLTANRQLKFNPIRVPHKISKLYFFSGLITIMAFASCDRNRVYEKYIKIPNYAWHKDSVAFFAVDIQDTISLHNFYIDIRHTGAYKWSNIYMFIDTQFPSGKRFRDTVNCILANNKGRWLGDGVGDLWDMQVLFKKNVRFPEKGKYIFQFEQAQRAGKDPYIKVLHDISDVGLRIERQ